MSAFAGPAARRAALTGHGAWAGRLAGLDLGDAGLGDAGLGNAGPPDGADA